MKKQRPAPDGWKPLPPSLEVKREPVLNTFWMADLKKAGERAECLWSRNRKKGAR